MVELYVVRKLYKLIISEYMYILTEDFFTAFHTVYMFSAVWEFALSVVSTVLSINSQKMHQSADWSAS